MKIYPGRHKVRLKDQISVNTMPLAYVFNDDQDRVLDITIEPEFAKPYEEALLYPYQTLNTDNILLFNRNNRPVFNQIDYLKKIDNTWTILPQYAKEFYPKQFKYEVLVERDDIYRTDAIYNIDLCFTFDTIDRTRIGQALASLIANKGKERRYPSNIIINGGDVTLTTLVNLMELQENCDLLCDKAENFTAADIEEKLNKHINLWLYDDSFGNAIDNETDNGSYTVMNHQVFASGSGTLKPTVNGYANFKEDVSWEILEEISLTEVPFFTGNVPIRIYKKEKGGFLILSHTSFLENLNTSWNDSSHLRLFFELLVYVYLHGYYKTEKRTTWITDEPIDYYINTNKAYNICHPKIELKRILAEEGYDIRHRYRIVDVMITGIEEEPFNIFYIRQNRFGELIFKKESDETAKDPAKGNNILIYTVHKSLLLCSPEDIVAKLIETGVKVRIIDEYHIGVSAMRSSKYNIFTEEEQVLYIDQVGEYDIVCRDNTFYLAGPGIKVAHISVKINTDVAYKDIRKMGGGEASAIPNYEMIDTGNRYGRPYRYGCPIIIRLPSRFKPMKEQIRSEVEKHIASGDYPIILYEE